MNDEVARIDGLELVIGGRVPRIAKLKNEYYEYLTESTLSTFVHTLPLIEGADTFTFLQRSNIGPPVYELHHEFEDISVLRLESYDHWWKKQINDKTRNMVRKAYKKGIDIRIVDFDDDLVVGIQAIYNESRLRQGRPFAHYGKDLPAIKSSHETFLAQSEFIGAYFEDQLVGFLKLVHGEQVSNVMQIVAMISHQDKAPTNALLAKAVEICANRGVPMLHYGLWSRRGLGAFKRHHAFQRLPVPRYFVPLNAIGSIALKLGLHRTLANRLPGSLVDRLVETRTMLNEWRYRS